MKTEGQIMMLRSLEVWTIRQVCLNPLELALGQEENRWAETSRFPKVTKETSLSGSNILP